jgi:hypothetical protein
VGDQVLASNPSASGKPSAYASALGRNQLGINENFIDRSASTLATRARWS